MGIHLYLYFMFMAPVKNVQFNQLISSLNLILGQVSGGRGKGRGAVVDGFEGTSPLNRLKSLLPSIIESSRTHNAHMPVLLTVLGKITSNVASLANRKDKALAKRNIASLIAKEEDGVCSVCNGSCSTIYEPILSEIRDTLITLSPKAISTILSTYRKCKKSSAKEVILELELRSAYFIYAALPNVLSDVLKLVNVSALNGGKFAKEDYLVDFLRLINEVNGGTLKCAEEDSQNVLDKLVDACKKHAKFYLPVSLMDVCTTLYSIKMDSPLKPLLLNLSSEFLRTNSSDLKTRELPMEEISLLCRTIGLLSKLDHIDEHTVDLASYLLKKYLRMLNTRDLIALLKVFIPRDASLHGPPAVNLPAKQCEMLPTDKSIINILDEIVDYCLSLIYDKSLGTFSKIELSSLVAMVRTISRNAELDDAIKHFLIYNILGRNKILQRSENTPSLVMLTEYLNEDQVYAALVPFILEGNMPFSIFNMYDYIKLIQLFKKFEDRMMIVDGALLDPSEGMKKYIKRPPRLDTKNILVDVKNCRLMLIYKCTLLYNKQMEKSSLIDLVYFLNVLLYILESENFKKTGVLMTEIKNFATKLEHFHNANKGEIPSGDSLVILKFIQRIKCY